MSVQPSSRRAPDPRPELAVTGTVTAPRSSPLTWRPRVRRDSVYRRALAVADASAAVLGVLVAVTFFGGAAITAATVLVIPIALVLSKLLGLYDRDELVLWTTTLEEAPGVFLLSTLLSISIWLGERFLIAGHLEKTQFVAAWITFFVVGLAGRAIARRCARALSEPERCLVLGDKAAFDAIEKRLNLGDHGTVNVVSWVALDEHACDKLLAGGLAQLAKEAGIQRVVIMAGSRETEAVLQLVRVARGLHLKVSLIPEFLETMGSLVVDEMPGTALLAVRRFGPSKSSAILKRCFDVLVAGSIVVVAAPALATIVLLVKLDSRGPVLFRQTRVGRNGRPFKMLKFRTMVPDAEALRKALESHNESDGLFKIADDPRMTRTGRWLRRANLDELPQLANVLRGDMSLVGPRPLVPADDARIHGWHRQRLEVPPGMTGHWQVLGAARVSLSQMVVIDYLYIANWSLWLDVKCLLRTAHCVFGRRGL
jgi:exopolysaccharide biosynthesis polyprenyl glycosylphosphotransferase